MNEEGGNLSEAARIRAAYAARDAQASSVYTYANPAYHFHVQDLEWQVLRALRRAGRSLHGASVLEVGSGYGQMLARLVELGAGSGVGVDLAENRVQEARRRYPLLRFECGDAAELPFADDAFDLVTQFVCLSSVLDAEVRQRIAAEMWRVTAPGGALLSYDLRPMGNPIRAGARVTRGRPSPAPAEGTPTRPVSTRELAELFPGPAQIHVVTLNFDRAGLAGRSVLLAHLLRQLRFLRTHYLAVVLKP